MIKQHQHLNIDKKRRRSDQEKIEAFFALEHEFDQKNDEKRAASGLMEDRDGGLRLAINNACYEKRWSSSHWQVVWYI